MNYEINVVIKLKIQTINIQIVKEAYRKWYGESFIQNPDYTLEWDKSDKKLIDIIKLE